jgi:hypothetical protein
MKKSNVNAALAMFFIAFAVVIMTTAGLVVIPPVATQEAQVLACL